MLPWNCKAAQAKAFVDLCLDTGFQVGVPLRKFGGLSGQLPCLLLMLWTARERHEAGCP